MANRLVRLLLVITALSPMLGAIATGKDWMSWLPWLAPAVSLAIICWLMLRWCGTHLQRTPLGSV